MDQMATEAEFVVVLQPVVAEDPHWGFLEMLWQAAVIGLWL